MYRSRRQSRKPSWWLLYLLVPLVVGLFLMVDSVAIPSGWRPAAQIAVLLLVFALVYAWLERNSVALYSTHEADHFVDQTLPGGEQPPAHDINAVERTVQSSPQS